jgi:hypothetical protein
MNIMNFKEDFWFESNSCWGACYTFGELKDKMDMVIRDAHHGTNYEKLLDTIKKADRDHLNFGLRREHIGGQPLSEYLKETEQYDDLLKYLKDNPIEEPKD